MKKLLSFALASLLSTSVYAAGGAVELADIDIDTSAETVKRGSKVAIERCNLCHGFKYIKYRNLLEIGYTQAEVDVLRGSQGMGTPLMAKMPDTAAKRFFGRSAPDLSLMAKARKNGGRYIYTLLTTYHEVSETKIDNHLFPGIKMPDPLGYAIQEKEEEKQLREAKAHDVSAFLVWAADPRAEERRSLGVWVIGYLIILTIMLRIIKKRVWRRLPPPVDPMAK